MADSAALTSLRRTLQSYLEDIFGARPHADADGDFVIPHGRSVTWIRPLDWKEGQTIVRIWSITNVGMRADRELAKFILAENRKLVFGGFSLDRDRPAVSFGHTLLGDLLQRKELEIAVRAIAATSQEYGARIKDRFGGRLFTEGP